MLPRIALFLILLNIICVCQSLDVKDGNSDIKPADPSKENKASDKSDLSSPKQSVADSPKLPLKDNTTASVQHDEHNKTASASEKPHPADKNDIVHNHIKLDHPGALLRGFYVFLGLSVLVLGYFLIRAFRLRPGAPPSTTVRKYGVVGRRSDMEMLPLPLAEDEEDDTLFDVQTQVHR